MQEFIDAFNVTMFIIFTALYIYQIFYVFVSIFKKPKPFGNDAKLHRYGVIIAARNEENVIGHLIQSIKSQNYPSELVDIFVIADNCTDNTAQVSRDAGAIVYERFNKALVGKGYALDFLYNELERDYGIDAYDAYFIFDADNLLDKNYISEMNKTFDAGYRIVTSYRNSKNYDSNWLSAGYSLWFLREARFINQSRMILGTSCAVSGTGFMIHSDILKRNGGWKHHLLTEDIEFTVDSVAHGEKIGYASKAYLYDEQPTKFKQSWNQRLRWSKGFYQVFGNYAADLVKGLFKRRSFACYDFLMTISPAMFLTIFSLILNIIFLIYGVNSEFYYGNLIKSTSLAVFATFFNFYLVLYMFGLVTTIAERKRIAASTWKKILYTFTFPIFIFTYMPISIAALFKKVSWTPISHTVAKTIEDIQS